MRKYGLIVYGQRKSIYFNTIQERNKFIKTIKGIFTYTTFSKEEYKIGKCPECKKQLELIEMEIDGKLEKIKQCPDCKYWEILKESVKSG